MKKIFLLSALFLTACSARIVLTMETEDAVYGKTDIKKETQYVAPPPQTSFLESLFPTTESPSTTPTTLP